ncbi:hypothetical protein WKV44_01920 [Spirochaetia bacterium 38H-sp]|uniref:Uncharacterized protein n=1 Tax=Rarispira pelagica TaxID=3141764 RepID=A0ABU9U9E8_9SPIR
MTEQEKEIMELNKKIEKWKEQIQHDKKLIEKYEQYIANAEARISYLKRHLKEKEEK